jgi:hypothetical protein
MLRRLLLPRPAESLRVPIQSCLLLLPSPLLLLLRPPRWPLLLVPRTFLLRPLSRRLPSAMRSHLMTRTRKSRPTRIARTGWDGDSSRRWNAGNSLPRLLFCVVCKLCIILEYSCLRCIILNYSCIFLITTYLFLFIVLIMKLTFLFLFSRLTGF